MYCTLAGCIPVRRFCVAATAIWLLAAVPGLAQPRDRGARLKEHLEAGEFAPALNIARQADDARQRDAMLGQVAAAQAATGLRGGALATASMIDGDVARSEAVGKAATGSPSRTGMGGGSQADFQSLIDLITSTVAPTTWDDVGGPGSIAPFPSGVWVDANGAMHRLLNEELSARLDTLRDRAAQGPAAGSPRRESSLRKVSLPRLERAVQLRLAAGKPIEDNMRYLAGLQKVQFVLVYPETGDIVLAGPAGDWRPDSEARMVGVNSGRPVLQLDDLVVLLRHMRRPDATFGCSINPRPESLARTKTFLDESSRAPLKPNGRDPWLAKVRETMGAQDIEYYGIDPRTRVAQVLVEADYRMKLVGIGLEEGVLGVPSYLASIPKDKNVPPLGVLRWWFTLKYDGVATNPARDAYELRGQGVQVLSENELLDAMGQRVHTGDSEPLNREFARNFTQHFAELARKYPVYAELANLFDLALVCALMQSENVAERAGWHMTCLGDPKQFKVATGYAPKSVQSVVNHRTLTRTQFVAAVSGGVRFEASDLVKSAALQSDKSGQLVSCRAASAPERRPRDDWWWD